MHFRRRLISKWWLAGQWRLLEHTRTLFEGFTNGSGTKKSSKRISPHSSPVLSQRGVSEWFNSWRTKVAIRRVHACRRGVELVKCNIKSAFYLLPVYSEDFELSGFCFEGGYFHGQGTSHGLLSILCGLWEIEHIFGAQNVTPDRYESCNSLFRCLYVCWSSRF